MSWQGIAARLCVAVSIVCDATAALAQEAGHILHDNAVDISSRPISPEDQARDTMNRYGICVVKMKSVAVKRAISMPTDAEISGALAKIAMDDCLTAGMLKMPRTLFRGAVFRALYLRDFFNRKSQVAPMVPGRVVTSVDPIRVFGECVLRADFGSTRDFVVAVAASSEERSAIRRLGPALGQCVAPSQQIRFSRASLQGILAEALYRGATAAPIASATPDQR